MTTSDIRRLYTERYAKPDITHLYPVEFVVRAFLGSYPDLRLNRSKYHGSNLLDLGFGDGRNMPLLHNLGFRIHGVEIHEEIVRSGQARLNRLGIDAALKSGSNVNIPFESNFFDYVLACHSCYYVENGTTFTDNLREIHRVMRKDAIFICSLSMQDTYLLDGADVVGDGHWRITHDPYGLRVGTIFRAFKDEADVVRELGPYFSDVKVGFIDDMYWGIRVKAWTVVCKKH